MTYEFLGTPRNRKTVVKNAVIIEHAKMSKSPEAWREKLTASEAVPVTVRVEPEVASNDAEPPTTEHADDPFFEMWCDREEMTDAEAYVRKLRAPRV